MHVLNSDGRSTALLRFNGKRFGFRAISAHVASGSYKAAFRSPNIGSTLTFIGAHPFFSQLNPDISKIMKS